MNRSIVDDPRSWKKWYGSGAVRQPEFPHGTLVVDSISPCFRGPGAGFQTLSLGRRMVSSFVHVPIISIVVPTVASREIGDVLESLPRNAVPVGIFYHTS